MTIVAKALHGRHLTAQACCSSVQTIMMTPTAEEGPCILCLAIDLICRNVSASDACFRSPSGWCRQSHNRVDHAQLMLGCKTLMTQARSSLTQVSFDKMQH